MKVQSINPATGEIIKQFTPSTSKEVNIAVIKAKKAQIKWNKISVKERSKYFNKLKLLIENNLESIVRLIMLEVGRMRADAEAEVYEVIDAIDYYYDQIINIKPQKLTLNPEIFPNTKFQVKYVPQGVIALIMPWNFPFYIPMMYAIPAIYAGNAVLFKPSEYSTLVGLEIKKLFDKSCFPEELFQILIGGDNVGKTIIKSDIDKVFCVGSVNTGKDIIKNIGVKSVQLELGGNSTAVVLEDANIDLAVDAITWGGVYNAGQECVRIKRVFVMEKIADEFISKVTKTVTALMAEIDYGPYIREDAMIEIEKGLIVVVPGSKIKKFTSAAISRVYDYIENQKIKSERKTQQYNNALENLQKQMSVKRHANVEFFNGLEEVQKYYLQINENPGTQNLKSMSKFLRYSVIGDVIEQINAQKDKDYKKLGKNFIPKRTIAPDDNNSQRIMKYQTSKHKSWLKTCDFRLVDFKSIPFDNHIYITDTYVAMFSLTETETWAIKFLDKSVINTFNGIFEALWVQGKSFNNK